MQQGFRSEERRAGSTREGHFKEGTGEERQDSSSRRERFLGLGRTKEGLRREVGFLQARSGAHSWHDYFQFMVLHVAK